MLEKRGQKANFGAVKICLFAQRTLKNQSFNLRSGLMVSEVEPSNDIRGRKLV
jgi:hypothetical protein